MRVISSSYRTDIESQNGTDVDLIFATITHPILDSPRCVNSDVVNYIFNGVTFFGVGVAVSLVTDDDSPPKATFLLEAVDRRLTASVLSIYTAPQVQIQVLRRSDFDNLIPRNPIGTPTVQYNAPIMFLRNVQWNDVQMSGDLSSYDLTARSWPNSTTNPIDTPALFR